MITELPLYNKILILLINFIAIWLAVAVYSNNHKGKINKIFLLMIASMFLWVDFAYLARLLGMQSANLGLIFLKIAWFASPFLFVSLYFFVVFYLNNEKKYIFLNRCILFSGIVLSLITIFTNLIVQGIEFIGTDLSIIYGKGMFLFLGIIFIFMCAPLYLLVKEYTNNTKKERTRIEYLLLGISIFYFGNIIFGIILPIFYKIVYLYWLGDYSAIFLLGFTAYAIIKHELMGIKTLLTQMLIAIMSIILLVDIIVLSTNDFTRIMKIGVLITFLYFGKSLIEGVKKEKKIATKLENANEKIKHYVDKLEDNNKILEEGNQNMKALIDVGNIAIDANDSKKIAQGIVDIIPKSLKHLGIVGGVFLTYNRNKKTINPYAITETAASRKAMKYLIKPFNKYKVLLTDIDNLVAQTIKKKRIFIGQKLEDFISPPVNTNICKMIQKVTRAKSFLSLPLYSNGVVIGSLLFFGLKKEKEITEKDINILEIFSSHIGNAIENARLYEQTVLQIAELAKLNKNLGLKNVQLKELLEIKNEFLHITSHQLRTPLTVIRGMISMWVNGDFDHLSKMEKKKMIKRILVSTERLNNITNDMLDALELEGGFLKFQFQKSSIIDIVKETISTLKPNFDKKKLYIKIIIEKNIPDVDVEPNYIRQVFMNTIDNACKYTNKGGITISLKKKDKKYVEVKIKDTGVGIKKDEVGKIFKKFFRGKNAIAENASGSGLGLFIARKILMSHSGKINFKSDGLDKGTTISILLKINQK